MTRAELARMLDHSVLKPESTLADVHAGIDVVRLWHVGCYCVQPCRVRVSAEALAGTGAVVASVVGFPHGAHRMDVKASEAALAIDDGAREIDMVVDLGALRDGDAARVAADIEAVVRACGEVPVEAIIEASALDEAHKRLACRLAREAGAAFVKTSTGFHASGGATVADVRLMRGEVGSALGVKASGGIRTLADALAMIEAGASRIGTSASAAILGAIA